MENNNLTGWLQHASYDDAEAVIDGINVCKGWPDPSTGTETWGYPTCYQNGYSPSATTESYFVMVKDEIKDCLTQEQWDSQVQIPEGWVECGETE